MTQLHNEAVATKGSRTRQRIVKSAYEVFGADGFTNARVRDIAIAAGLSEGALYRYFRSKGHLFEAVLDELFVAVYQAATDGDDIDIASDPRLALAAANRRFLDAYWHYRHVYRAFRETAVTERLYRERWHDIRAKFRSRFVHVYSTRFGVEPSRELELMVYAVQCCVEEFAYAMFTDGAGETFHPSVTIDEVAEITAHVWYEAIWKAFPPRAGIKAVEI